MNSLVNVLDIAELPAQEMLSILRQGTVLRLPHLENKLRQAQAHVQQFEMRYSLTLAELTTQGLPDDAGYEMHEDFIEWEYWQDTLEETELVVRNMKKILTNVEQTGVLH